MKSIEISGIGKEYEAACQRMLFHGLKILGENSTEKLDFVKGFGTRGANQFTKDLLNEIADKAPNPSGAMIGAVASHLWHIETIGFDEWLQKIENEEPSRIVKVNTETGFVDDD